MRYHKELIDTTLRDGEQAPGIIFSAEQRRHLAEQLIIAGVDEIEAGVPVMGPEVQGFIRWLNRNRGTSRVSAWSRLRREDLETAYDTGVEIIHITVPVSDYHVECQLGSWKEVRKQLDELILYSQDHFNHISIGVQDSFRAPLDRIDEVCLVAEARKIFRIRFSDSVGNAMPSDVAALINRYRNHFSGSIDFHGHNDFGLALANSLSAMEAGADSVNTTINGIGERAGNTSLVEMAFILNQHSHFYAGIRMDSLKGLAEMTSEFLGRPLPLNAPLVGKYAFTHESGIHCHGQSSHPLAYQPMIPERTGINSTSYVVGTHSGRSSVRTVLEEMGIDMDICDDGLMKTIKNKAIAKKDVLTSMEVADLYKQYGGVSESC
jgi:homocitrate synthase NifV